MGTTDANGKSSLQMFCLKSMCIARCCVPIYIYIALCFCLAAIENRNRQPSDDDADFREWDVYPTSQGGRLFCAFVLPMGVMALTITMGTVSEELPKVGKGGEKSIKDLLEELKNVIDEDDDGTVTEEEYLLFCLKREQKVDEETL